MKRFLSKGKKGFTIVELVIVIGVIGILSAILIPTFVNLNSRASEAARKSDLAAVYTEYVADVADGYYGEKDPEHPDQNKADKTYGQQEVYLAIVADTATEKYYTYGTNPESEGWDTRAKASPADATHQLQQLGGDGNTYTSKGYAVYILVPVNPNPLF